MFLLNKTSPSRVETNDIALITDSLNKLDSWLTKNQWKAYDPFDGLSSKYAPMLTFNNHYLRIMWQQSVRRFPLNIRPLLDIKKATGSKGKGFCALGYLKMYEATQKSEYLTKLKNCLDWLCQNYNKEFSGYSWGNHFSYESRGGRISKGLPTIVWTSLIANVFLDAYDTLKDPVYLEVAKSAGDFIMNDIGRYSDSEDTFCFMYTPTNKNNPEFRRTIHNSNVLAGSLLSRLYKITGNKEILSLAKKSIYFTIKHQLSDGAWYYGEPKKYQWIDSFHTGYVLESIYTYMMSTGDKTVEEKLAKGYRYFLTTFFKSDGTPAYYNHKTYPIDIQCASQGIQTLVNLRSYDDSSLYLARLVARWTIKHMQDPSGYFYFRKYPFIINKTPMFHWAQATMLAALGALYKELIATGQ